MNKRSWIYNVRFSFQGLKAHAVSLSHVFFFRINSVMLNFLSQRHYKVIVFFRRAALLADRFAFLLKGVKLVGIIKLIHDLKVLICVIDFSEDLAFSKFCQPRRIPNQYLPVYCCEP